MPKILILRLIDIDDAQRIDKKNVFYEMNDLWKTGGLGTISHLKEQFGINKDFIKTSILMSLKLDKRKQIDTVQFIYETLKLGNDYKADGTTIPCTPEDIEFWSENRKQHQRFLNIVDIINSLKNFKII